jgi:pimeloyl-ACP methyl ester carboxylesterase
MLTDYQVGAQRVAVDVRGSGTPVLLLHSSGLSHQQWRRLRDLLEPSHRVLAPDFIGYGASAPWTGADDFEYPADVQVAEAIAAREERPVHVVGHSYGGFIALKVAVGHKVRIASVSVFDPVAFGVLYSANDREGIADVERADADGRFFAPELAGTAQWAERFVDYWGGAGYWARLPEPQRQAFLSSGRKMFEEVRSLTKDRTTVAEYATITAPTLVLTGTASPAAGQRTAAVLARGLPHAHLLEIAGAGHMGPLTHSGPVNAAIASHIERVDGSSSK